MTRMVGFLKFREIWSKDPLPTVFVLLYALKQHAMGRRQVVRHRLLMPAFAGSNPAAPAKFFECPIWTDSPFSI
jgi:hypothetical protein